MIIHERTLFRFQIRNLLATECDIIYECKVCRNIFRSLANFISHKRIYCRNAFNSSIHFNFHNGGCDKYSQDITTIAQAESDYISAATRTGRGQEKDLSSIVERLVKRERANQMRSLSEFYEQVNDKLTRDELLKRKYELQLDAVPKSRVAVYQTVRNGDLCGDDIKTEILEINELTSDDKRVLGPDGRLLDAAELPSLPTDEVSTDDSLKCKICEYLRDQASSISD